MLASACARSDAVIRVADGHVIPGRFIGEQAYGAFLIGALADESGDLHLALGAYEHAAHADGHSPELWTRVGRTLCRLDPHDARADGALDEALKLDAAYEPALRARDVCAVFRRDGAPGVDALLRAEELDPRGPAAYILRVAAQPCVDKGSTLPELMFVSRCHRSSDDVRHRLEALTLLHGNRVAAWEALATWGLEQGDAALAVRGMIGVARRAPARRVLLGHAAASFAASGHPIEARQLAAALLDADKDRSSAGEGKAVASLPLVARLAIDQAILDRDPQAVYARTTQAHVGVEVAAGRAWAMGNLPFARTLIESTVKADPTNLAARLVYEGASGRGASWLLPASTTTSVPLPPEVALPLARLVLVGEGVAGARRVMAFGGGTKVLVLEGDTLLTPLAVDLVVAGVVTEDSLPADARVAVADKRRPHPSVPSP